MANLNLRSVSIIFLIILPMSTPSSIKFDPTKVTQLSWHPRVFIYKGFLRNEECDHLINLATGKLVKSMVVDDKTNKVIESEERTSSGMFLYPSKDETVSNIEARIASWTLIPVQNGELINILRYENGEKYDPHWDYFESEEYGEKFRGGHRVATILMYLSDVLKGGETVFPNSDKVQAKDGNWSDCAKGGFAVKPKKGDAVLFFNLHPNATTDPSSLHGSCPVIEGEKWSATKWIHVRSFVDRVSSV